MVWKKENRRPPFSTLNIMRSQIVQCIRKIQNRVSSKRNSGWNIPFISKSRRSESDGLPSLRLSKK